MMLALPLTALPQSTVDNFLSIGGYSVRMGAKAAVTATLSGARLEGVPSGSGALQFRLTGRLDSPGAGSRLQVLGGRAALESWAAGEGWHVEIGSDASGHPAYDLVSERRGSFKVSLGFVAAISDAGGWKRVDFSMPAGEVVPVVIRGIGSSISFDPAGSVVPTRVGSGWEGFLPQNGAAAFSWRTGTREEGPAALSFTTTALTDVRIGAGLLSQEDRINVRVLQGRLPSLTIRLEGSGAILGVDGSDVVGWAVEAGKEGQLLAVSFGRPVEEACDLVVRSQLDLGALPSRVVPIRLVPQGVVRHSGMIRLSSQGLVRFDVENVAGLMQLPAERFPQAAVAGARQVAVYRVPSETYSYAIAASAIAPEVSVSEVTTYELSDAGRGISAEIELDVREAQIRDWSMEIPQGYSVVALDGADVADFSAESAVTAGYRNLRVLFAQPVDGRRLLHLRLERDQPATAGSWALPPLHFPGAKSVRGSIGVVTSAGFRAEAGTLGQLADVPLGYFPGQTPGLQLAWRIRDTDWMASVKVEAVGQSIQADVLHLYTVNEGIVYGSVIINYFVVGAPVMEWRIAAPASLGNIDVTGDDVQRDWRREGDNIVISLHHAVVGGSTILVTFEQPMNTQGGAIEAGLVRPLGVQSERGYVEVVSPTELRMTLRKAEGSLLSVEPSELPPEFRLLSGSPALAAYQYTARPFTLQLGVQSYGQAEMAAQLVDFANLESTVSRDGQVITNVRYFVKTHGRKSLRIQVPPGLLLWETRVDGKLVSAQVDGGDTLIPLPARANPNDPVPVCLRLGQPASGGGDAAPILAPTLMESCVAADWTVHGEQGRTLIPSGGTADLVQASMSATGFEWIAFSRPWSIGILLLAACLAAVLSGFESPAALASGIVCGTAAAIWALFLGAGALADRHPDLADLRYTMAVVPPGGVESISVRNVGTLSAHVCGWGIAALVLGAGVLAIGAFLQGARAKALVGTGCGLVAAGLLAQHGGAVFFIAAVFTGLVAGTVVPCFRRLGAAGRRAPSAGTSHALPVVIAGLLMLSFGSQARAAEPTVLVTCRSISQEWTVSHGRISADVDFEVNGGRGDNFVLLSAPGVLTGFSGDGLRVEKGEWKGAPAYHVLLQKSGDLKGHARYEMPAPDLAGGVAIPTGAAVIQKLSIEIDQEGWEFVSPQAAEVRPRPGPAGRSAATLVFGPGEAPVVAMRAKARDPGLEDTRFFAEVSSLFIPGPGVVESRAQFSIRPAQGKVAAVDIEVPAGFTVGDVAGRNIGAWRFDPASRVLRVTVEPARSDAFSFMVIAQLGAGSLPFDLVLSPYHVRGASGEVGALAAAFGAEAQPEAVTVSGLSTITTEDFDEGLVPKARDGRPLAAVQRVWRYGEQSGSVALRVTAVAPEIRSACKQVISIDDERLVMAADLDVDISRAGVFDLSFELPDGLDVESLTGPELSQWTQSPSSGARVVTMHLSARTIGETTFSMSLTGSAPRPQAAWPLPRIAVREATRQTGVVLVVPGRGLRLRETGRNQATPIDPADAGGMQPGTLAFKTLQGDWSVRVGIEALEPWVSVQSLEQVSVREGQDSVGVGLRLKVESAPVRRLRIALPLAASDAGRTVRATGKDVSDIVRVPVSQDEWEIRFQRSIIGETDVQVEFQRRSAEAGSPENLLPPAFPDAREVTQYLAVRAAGRLELSAHSEPKGWVRTDWASVPQELQARMDRSIPVLCYRVAEADGPLSVSVRRHEIAGELKLSVDHADLLTLVSRGGPSMTVADFRISVPEKGTLRVSLPLGARLVSAQVNGEGSDVATEGNEFLFHVSAQSGTDPSAVVHLAYSELGKGAGGDELSAPGLGIPLQNVTWRVVVPPGLSLARYGGSLALLGSQGPGAFGLQEYSSAANARKDADERRGVWLLERAGQLLQSGDQQHAGEMLSLASNSQLDAASNEDARVQLRVLKTEQTLLSLNTRRQRVYLDNKAGASRNVEMERAVTINPFMRGAVNFDPQQVDELLAGNSADENASLRAIAGRMVDQQLADRHAPAGIDVSIPECGNVLVFGRSLQVDGRTPLALNLSFAENSAKEIHYGILVLLLVAAACSAAVGSRGSAPSDFGKEKH